ncbi:MAG: phosphoesterase [Betaproteobacteria bacterium]|nr:phosphoesterase [Betaproteobacteria bacterium]
MTKKLISAAIAATLSCGVAMAHEHADRDDHVNGIPHLDHVFLIMMENHAYGQIIGNANAPFMNGMARTANLATNYYGVGHPSLTNYLEVVGGSNFGVLNDHSPDWHNDTCKPNLASGVTADESAQSNTCPIADVGREAPIPVCDDSNEGSASAPMDNFDPVYLQKHDTTTCSHDALLPDIVITGKTIADQLVEANKTWKSYQEDLGPYGVDRVNGSDGSFSEVHPNPVDPKKTVAKYAVKHNPFVYFANVQANTDPKNGFGNVADFIGLNGLYADLATGHVPNLAFIAPNQCHDMHGKGGSDTYCNYDDAPPKDNPALIAAGDTAVRELVTAIKQSKVWRRGKNAIVIVFDENDYSTAPNRVVTLVDINYGKLGVSSDRPYDHFSLLKTLEAGFGLDCLNHACDGNVTTMNDLFGR